ncbi:MAG: S8 family peptidase [Bdellovibrionales bacterium]
MLQSFALALLLFLVACSQNKSSETVFDRTRVSCSGGFVEGKFVVEYENGTIETIAANSEEELIEDFIEPNLERIKLVERDSIISIQQFKTSSKLANNWHLDAINLGLARTLNLDGSGVTVAVMDSGIDHFHRSLDGKIAINIGEIPNNFIDDDNNGYVDDYWGFDFVFDTGDFTDRNGHGTHVSGIIAGDSSRSLIGGPVIGVAPGVKILPVKFMSASGGGSISDLIEALDYVSTMKPDIVNASWGGSGCSQIVNNKIFELGQQDILFITASGNEGTNVDTQPVYPGVLGYGHMINVAASDSISKLAVFSNFGISVDIAAPGVSIYSSLPFDNSDSWDGTSMAAPIVVAAAALLKQAKPSASASEIKKALLESSDFSSVYTSTGGVLNISRAIENIKAN